MILSYSNNWFARRHNEEKEDYILKRKEITLKLKRANTERPILKYERIQSSILSKANKYMGVLVD